MSRRARPDAFRRSVRRRHAAALAVAILAAVALVTDNADLLALTVVALLITAAVLW